MLNHVMQFSNLKKTHIFWSWKCDHTDSLGVLKNTNPQFSVRVTIHYWIQIHPASKGRTTTFKEMRTVPAEILLISQTRSPSRSPPKAKTNGKSGQQAAQKRTPWQGGRKKERKKRIFFFFKFSNEFVTWKYFHQVLTSVILSFWNFFCKDTKWKSRAANYEQLIRSLSWMS